MPNSTDSRRNTESRSTHDEIEKRAYELYLQGGEAFSATEHWLIAEEGLRNERATADAKLTKEKATVAVAGRAVKRYS